MSIALGLCLYGTVSCQLKQKAKFQQQQTIKKYAKKSKKKELLNKEEEEEEKTFVHIDKESSITHAHHYGHTNLHSYSHRMSGE